MERYPQSQRNSTCEGEGGFRGGNRKYDRRDYTKETSGKLVKF